MTLLFEAAGLIPQKTMIKQLFRANVKYGGRQVKHWVGGALLVVPRWSRACAWAHRGTGRAEGVGEYVEPGGIDKAWG